MIDTTCSRTPEVETIEATNELTKGCCPLLPTLVIASSETPCSPSAPSTSLSHGSAPQLASFHSTNVDEQLAEVSRVRVIIDVPPSTFVTPLQLGSQELQSVHSDSCESVQPAAQAGQ